MKTALAALVIALISLIATIVLGTKNYRKSKRLEFFQRRDQLFARISDLNAKNTESHLISARYAMVKQVKMSQVFDEEFSVRNEELITSIDNLRDKIELAGKHWDGLIDDFHSICSNLTHKNDTELIEHLLAVAQVASDQLKKGNDISLSSLQILEGTDLLLKADMEKLEEYESRLEELNSKTESKIWLPPA